MQFEKSKRSIKKIKRKRILEEMKVAKSEEEISQFAEGNGSRDCAIQAFRQGKKVLLCTPESKIEDILKSLTVSSDDF